MASGIIYHLLQHILLPFQAIQLLPMRHRGASFLRRTNPCPPRFATLCGGLRTRRGSGVCGWCKVKDAAGEGLGSWVVEGHHRGKGQPGGCLQIPPQLHRSCTRF